MGLKISSLHSPIISKTQGLNIERFHDTFKDYIFDPEGYDLSDVLTALSRSHSTN